MRYSHFKVNLFLIGAPVSQFKIIYSLFVSFLQDKEIQELTAELENASQQCEAHRAKLLAIWQN